VSTGSEQGLLSVAFHPRYRETGWFYVNFTNRSGDTRVVRYRANPAADTADPASATVLLAVDQPYANHNGGHVLFGPDGALYVAMGDGGAGGDPRGHAQDPRSLLGKLLRLDADADPERPPRTPVIEVWALGLRNPWRVAFDSGLVYIADVGQNRWEEVNVAPADRRGLNYGWRTMEGAHCYRNPWCDRDGLVLPAVAYGHGDGDCSVIGGVVYRGRAVPALVGHYLYSDWCGGWLRTFAWRGAATDQRRWAVPNVGMVTSFGTDGAGEVYLIAAGGTVYRITAVD
jgi:glucose/arabinose dehydrogenase